LRYQGSEKIKAQSPYQHCKAASPLGGFFWPRKAQQIAATPPAISGRWQRSRRLEYGEGRRLSAFVGKADMTDCGANVGYWPAAPIRGTATIRSLGAREAEFDPVDIFSCSFGIRD
jgi:hypothetical protein